MANLLIRPVGNKITVEQARKVVANTLDYCRKASTDARSAKVNSFDDLLNIGYQLAQVEDAARSAQAYWVIMAVAEGASWKQIGDRLGMTKQAAHKRFGPLINDSGELGSR